VGRWFCHITEGKIFHDGIALARPFPHEHAAGWLGHYAVGIIYAGLLLALARPDWPAAPSLAPALAVGLITVGAGWFCCSPPWAPASQHPGVPTPDRSGPSTSQVMWFSGLGSTGAPCSSVRTAPSGSASTPGDRRWKKSQTGQ
jgi:hypothetical protein